MPYAHNSQKRSSLGDIHEESRHPRKPGDGIGTSSGAATSLFRELSPSDAAAIERHGKNVSVAEKRVLCVAGEPAGRLFLLRRGRVKYSLITSDGNEIVLRLFTPGEAFGLGAVLPDPPKYLGTAETVCASDLIVWDHTRALEISDRYQRFATNALRIALEYLGSLADRHSTLFEGDATRRIARVLVDISRRSGNIHPQGIDVHITNEQLGSLADVSKFTATRVLSGWKQRGVITKKRETVRIHSPESLLVD